MAEWVTIVSHGWDQLLKEYGIRFKLYNKFVSDLGGVAEVRKKSRAADGGPCCYRGKLLKDLNDTKILDIHDLS